MRNKMNNEKKVLEEKIQELNISTNQYIFIKSLSSNQLAKGIKSFAISHLTNEEFTDLINKKILTENSTVSESILTDEFIESQEEVFDKDLFAVFYEIYPTSVLRPDGIKDYLRTDLNRCKKLYKQIIGNSRIKHDHLIKCLNFEIEQKRKTNKMGYFKRMRTWLASEQWIEAEEAMKDRKSPILVTSYGTDIE